MDVVAEIVRNIAVLVILAVFLEMLLPAGELSQFVRLVMGLLLLASVLNPLLSLVGQQPSTPVFVEEDYSQETEAVLEEGQKLSGSLEQRAVNQYQEGLKGQIESLVLLVPQVVSAEIELSLSADDTIIEQVKIVADIDSGASDSMIVKQKIKSTVGGFFSLDEKYIEVILQKGGVEDE